jgi:hypothetical protein
MHLAVAAMHDCERNAGRRVIVEGVVESHWKWRGK